MTHINWAFAIPTSDATIRSLSNTGVLTKLISTAHSKNVKVMLSVGGWSYNGVELENTFVQATNTDAKCQKLANAILSIVDQYGFDGADIDWEYPRSNTSGQYEKFITYLKQGLTSRGKSLSAAVVGSGDTGYGLTDNALKQLDWINIMAYDGDAGSGHSPYSYAVSCGEYWIKTRGVSKEKVNLGVPFYERPNWAAYSDIVAANSANAYKDSTVINGTTVYYNGIPTMKEKTTWACNNAGGIMIWEITQDTTNSSLSLLNAIYDTAKELLNKEVVDVPSGNSVRVEAENYTNISSAQKETCDEGGQDIGYIATGAYMDYTVNVPTDGVYRLKIRAAGATNEGTIQLVENNNTLETMNVPATGGWQTWKTYTGSNTFELTAGSHNIRLNVTKEGFNLNWFELEYVKAATPTVTPTPTTTPSQYQEYDSATVYVQGDRVTYKGVNYEAQWWTRGELPDTCGEWGVWRVVAN